MGSEASKAGDYKEPDLPEGILEVRLSVYKLKLTGLGPLDELGSSMFGAYHSGLVVAGEEWAFGGHDQEGLSGVYTTAPEINTEYSFYSRLVMGQVRKTKEQVHAEILNLAAHPRWGGPRYELTQRNCNHFASDVCWMLLKKRPPDWINSTAEGIWQQNRVRKALTESSAAALHSYCVAVAPNGTVLSVDKVAKSGQQEQPGETAFKSTYSGTFNIAWERGWETGKRSLADSREGVDPEEMKASLELSVLDFAAEASEAAAWAVAAGARKARAVRAELVASGRPGVAAWDEAWKSASAPLVAQWRDQALRGELRRSQDEAGVLAEAQRMQQVEEALALAAAAAEKAAVEADSATAADPSLAGYHP